MLTRQQAHLLILVVSSLLSTYLYFNQSRKYTSKAYQNKARIFTRDELSKYDGIENANKEIYLALLGKVYNVTKGVKHYGPGQTYSHFAARDATRAFIDRDTPNDGSLESFEQLEMNDLKSLEDWQAFYEREYTFIGYLNGFYYDEFGNPTYKLHKFWKIVGEMKRESEENASRMAMYPPCNVEYNPSQGTRVWCTNRSGGIARDWVGYPRKLYDEKTKTVRCACLNDNQLAQKNIEEYENCSTRSSSCIVVPDDLEKTV